VDFAELVQKNRKQRGILEVPEDQLLLCFDPGHTTGWATFEGLELVDCGQIDTREANDAVPNIMELFRQYCPSVLVYEDYRVYKWKAENHVGSELVTTRVIGTIETIAVQNFVSPIISQPAHLAKRFCTDKKLKEWDFYVKGERHACDAIRHGAYYLIFGAARKADRHKVTVG